MVSLVHPTRIPLCPTCGMGVDPERYATRPYCTDPECVAENARPQTYALVGVHKSIPTIVPVTDATRLAGAGRRRA